jgi:hypothetical protein
MTWGVPGSREYSVQDYIRRIDRSLTGHFQNLKSSKSYNWTNAFRPSSIFLLTAALVIHLAFSTS